MSGVSKEQRWFRVREANRLPLNRVCQLLNQKWHVLPNPQLPECLNLALRLPPYLEQEVDPAQEWLLARLRDAGFPPDSSLYLLADFPRMNPVQLSNLLLESLGSLKPLQLSKNPEEAQSLLLGALSEVLPLYSQALY